MVKRTWLYTKEWALEHYPETAEFFQAPVSERLARELATSYIRNCKRTERRERYLTKLMARRDARRGPFAEDPEWSSAIPF